jgi:hypothetical protein
MVKPLILKALEIGLAIAHQLMVYFSPGPFLAPIAGQERSNPTHVKAIEHPGGR